MLSTVLLCACLALSAAAQVATLDSLLAKLPAQDNAVFNDIHAQLLGLGEGAVLELADRMTRGASPTQMEYALSGLAKYVTRPGADPAERAAFGGAVAKAIGATTHAKTRAFLIQQLLYAGGDEAVPALQALLTDEAVGTDARMILETIGTPAALAALGQAPPPAAPEVAATPELTDPVVAWTRVVEPMLETDPAGAFEIVLSGLEGGNDDIRAAAAGIAASHYADAKYTSKLDRLAKRGDGNYRAEYLAMLGARGDEKSLRTIDDFLDDDDEAIRRAALGAVLAIGGGDADKLIEELFEEAQNNENFRRLEADLLAVTGGDAYVLPADAEGFQPIFNGKDLRGWMGFLRGYAVEDGAIVCKDSPLNIMTIKEFSNFALRFEFNLTPGANNGIGLRAPEKGKVSEEGLECQVLDEKDPQYADLEPYQFHGSIYGLVPAISGHVKGPGEWNEQEIRMEGSRVVVTLNGTVIVDADLIEATKDGAMDGKEHPGVHRTSGRIALLGHGDTVYFRNLRVKELS
jgi:hypothetical protein